MEHKFKYNDKVRVIKGFYEGLVGKIISFHTTSSSLISEEKIYYIIRFDEKDPDQTEFFDRSFYQDGYIEKV